MNDGYEKTITIDGVGEFTFALPTGEAAMNFMHEMKAKTVISGDEMSFTFDPFANSKKTIQFISVHLRRWNLDKEITYDAVAKLPMRALMELSQAIIEAEPEAQEMEKN